MSELKAFNMPRYAGQFTQHEVYLKSEADKVIKELEDKLQAANEQIENIINSASRIMLFQDRVKDNKFAELRHQKYRRCLAMAWFCHYIAAWDNDVYVHGGTSDDRLARLYWKWEKRWLELAEKFKDKEE
jgi:hypothetical protein